MQSANILSAAARQAKAMEMAATPHMLPVKRPFWRKNGKTVQVPPS